ncbi:hypothetical protein C0989_002723 [Termitomyces sp. Mn162]|nr:hypothetical protein C0989_002723 [Termitomyces sp. Mn162]
MAYVRRSPHHRDSSSPSARKYPLRRPSSTRRRRNLPGEPPHSSDIRQVLVPLHPNLRRLPSRLHLAQLPHLEKSDSHMARHAGVKRKRVESTNTSNENVSHLTRIRTRSKRLRSGSLPSTQQVNYSDGEGKEENGEENAKIEDGVSVEMDVDNSTTQESGSESSEEMSEEQEDDRGDTDEDEQDIEHSDEDEQDDSTDDYLVNSAQSKELFRLRKDVLIRLYHLADLSDDPEPMTKSDIISAIIVAREEDYASLPPSSPPGRGDGFSSEGASSDDGNEAGDEETDAGIDHNVASKSRLLNGSSLRRRATMGEVKNSKQTLKGRSLSMEHLLPQPMLYQKNSGRLNVVCEEVSSRTRRRSSNRSSSTISSNASSLSPLATRLRSRKVPTSSANSIHTPSKPTRAKGKAKQVQFDDDALATKAPSKRSREKEKLREEQARLIDEESDLTSLEELEASISKPSPRRLRSKDRDQISAQLSKSDKKTQRRAARGKAASPENEENEEDREEAMNDVEEDELIDEEAHDDQDTAEEDEVDELVSSASATPVPTPRSAFKGRRTPLRTRLRPRERHPPPPSDGDDEEDIEGDIEEEDEEDIQEEEDEEDIQEEEEEVDEAEAEEAEEEAEAEADGEKNHDDTIVAEPRRLRNGKIVGEEDANMEEDSGSADEDDEANDVEETEEAEEAEEGEGDEAAGDIDVDADGETEEDEVMEGDDDVDLTIATAKTLVRLRRDDLVRLCESRDLEPVGTKPQLAEALLHWRDRQGNEFSSPSSCGTVRPSSHSRRRRRIGHSSSTEDSRPDLLHSGHTIVDEPMTPVPQQQKDKDRLEKEPDQELELDLESLGLEDREIPPEKIQKLEKIGSGGFKDVFIGKFKGRKIAISEFRGQLSAMDIKELKLLGGFDHPNIVRFLGVSIPENTREIPVMIVSELCSNGDLFDYVRNVNPPTLHKVLVMMLDIARGLEYLHLRKPSVIHRDCKSSNILITAKGTAKIADFGLAKVKQSTRSMVRSLVGTVNWQAPELWHAHPKYNHKVDVFSCAMVYWEMLQWHLPNKKFPWEGMNEHAIYEIVGTKRQRWVWVTRRLLYLAFENNGAQKLSTL